MWFYNLFIKHKSYIIMISHHHVVIMVSYDSLHLIHRALDHSNTALSLLHLCLLLKLQTGIIETASRYHFCKAVLFPILSSN